MYSLIHPAQANLPKSVLIEAVRAQIQERRTLLAAFGPDSDEAQDHADHIEDLEAMLAQLLVGPELVPINFSLMIDGEMPTVLPTSLYC